MPNFSSRIITPLHHTLQTNRRLLEGTFLLTAAGVISRFIGFFYRIFLSRVFGAEGMGLYQLVSPVLALSFAICCSGIQTAISKFTAAEAKNHGYRHSYCVLMTGLSMALLLSFLCSLFVLHNSVFIAVKLLHEPRTEPLLRIIAVSIPFATIHSCINGYYYSLQKAKVPALTQLLEQFIRIGTVWALYQYSLSASKQISISIAVAGMLAGEIVSSVISIVIVSLRFHRLLPKTDSSTAVQQEGMITAGNIRSILSMSIPLSLSRVIVNLLSSVEAVYIPLALISYGLCSSDALSVYGILTGMALPLILFPCALTNSFSVLLLPQIAEAQEESDYHRIERALHKTARFSIGLGLFFCVLLLLLGSFAGQFFFHNTLAGSYIRLMSFLSPFLYLGTTMSGILHGLGKTGVTFLISICSLAIRLTAVFLLVPVYGMSAYIAGMLCSQVFAGVTAYLSAVFVIRRNRST